jgi:hypothetical protein
MKATLLCDAGTIEKGTAVEVHTKVASNNERCADDVGGQSTNDAPVYAVTDADGNAEEVDTRDLAIVP